MTATARHAPAIERVSTLELFLDLVFVFTITQLTAVLAHDPNPLHLGRQLRGHRPLASPPGSLFVAQETAAGHIDWVNAPEVNAAWRMDGCVILPRTCQRWSWLPT